MITTKCEQCGATISRKGSKPGRFCSLKCKGEWQRTQKPVDKAWLRQKYLDEGLSTYDIAKLVGRDSTRVHDWLVGYGITLRPRGHNLATTDDCYMRRPGAVNPFQGKTHTEETRRVLSEKAQVEKPYLRGEHNGMYGKYGAQNPNYIDGSSPERQRTYGRAEWKAVVRAIYARDNYQCVRCGAKHDGFHAHHIKPWAGNPELRTDPANLVTLCPACHRWVHSPANTDRAFL